MVQVEWAPVAAWDTLSKMATAVRSRGAVAVVHDRLGIGFYLGSSP